MSARVLVALVLPALSFGKWAPTEKVPLDRLMANVRSQFAQYPDQAEAHYLLGRLESLAYSGQADSVQVFRAGADDGLPPVAFWSWVQETADNSARPTSVTAATRDLFFSSIEHYHQAIALNSTRSLYHFSLAWMAEEGQRLGGQLGVHPADLSIGNTSLTWRMLAIREYDLAESLEGEPNQVGPGRVLALEAGRALVDVLRAEIQERKARALSERDKAFVADAEQHIQTIQAKLSRISRLPRAITPLIFSPRPNARLNDLLSLREVYFDLDGFSDGRSWRWVANDTAILVWDPERNGRILSGRQMFGTVTWWMFWKDGFEPLAALDNNGDGWLTGSELDGVSVWQDRNGNGVSDPGEVMTAQMYGIAAIRVRPEGREDGVRVGLQAVRMKDGRALKLFDWVPVGHFDTATDPLSRTSAIRSGIRNLE